MKLGSLLFLSTAVLLSAACSSTTVLLANFNAEMNSTRVVGSWRADPIALWSMWRDASPLYIR